MSALTIGTNPRARHAFGRLVVSEARIARRRPTGVAVALGVPLVLLVIFGCIPATTRPEAALGGISFFNLYVPSLLLFGLIAVGLAVLPQQLAGYRQQGVLRRMSTTPAPPSWLLAAQMTVNMALAAAGIALLLGLGAGVFGLALPHTAGEWLIALLTLVLTAGATLGLGLCVAAVAGTPQVANALTIVLFYPMAFFSGLYVPIQEIHSTVISDLAKVLPTGAGFTALHAAFSGQSPGLRPLLVLAAWAIGASVAAVRLFRWE